MAQRAPLGLGVRVRSALLISIACAGLQVACSSHGQRQSEFGVLHANELTDENGKARLPISAGPAADVPAQQSPTVTYFAGRLRIDAENETLAEVLAAIAQKTGARIDIPAGSGFERVVEHFGPAQPDLVVSELLNGSRFNFIIVDTPDGKLQQVLLSTRDATASSDNVAIPAAPPQEALRTPEASTEQVPPTNQQTLVRPEAKPSEGQLTPDEIQEKMKERAEQIRQSAQQESESQSQSQ